MHGSDVDRISAWLIDEGLAGQSETDLLHGFCRAARDAGLPLSRALLIVDTLHPIYEGRAFRWRGDGLQQESVIEYGRTDQGGEAEENWHRSPFFHLFTTGDTELRRSMEAGAAEFPLLSSMRDEGEIDYFAMVHRFSRDSVIGEMDCIYSQWTTQRPEGFTDDELAAIRRLAPPLVLAVKCASLARIPETLAKVYLGRDAGQRVLDGRISRGRADQVGAVLWFSDLRGYTTISDTAAPEEILPLLNDYAEMVISCVQEAGGDVLKLIGDGTLAVFLAEDPADACRCALLAERNLRAALAAVNTRRSAEGRPTTSVYLGLHIGEVFYGNIGSQDRLDFTVVGPAVNEVARIASMCRSVDRHVVMSSEFAASVPADERDALVSVGRFALRGVGRAKELFTIDPERL
jgi:adenylate cyclase